MSYKEKSVGTFLVGESAEIALNNGKETFGPAIDSPIGGYKVAVGVEVIKPSKGVVPVLLALSFDGSTFSNPLEMDAKVNLSKEGIQVVTVDMKEYRAPFYKLGLGAGKEVKEEEPKEAPKKDGKAAAKAPADEADKADVDPPKEKEQVVDTAPFGAVRIHYAAPTAERR